VHVGPVSDAIGLAADVVIIVGMAEGLLPARPGEDPLLPDDARLLTDGQLPTARQRLDRQHRHLLAALAGGSQQVIATYPRGDLRRGGQRVPSRWLLPTLRRLTGTPTFQATDPLVANGVSIVEVASYVSGIERADVPCSNQEWWQRSAAAARHAGDAPEGPTFDGAGLSQLLAGDSVAQAALALRDGRGRAEFSRFDGMIPGALLPDPTGGRRIAPTALEAWTACPHGYLVQFVLGVSAIEEPEEVLRISALERGTVMHQALEWWLQAEIDEGRVPEPDQPWSAQARARLLNQARLACEQAEQKGVTGYPVLWDEDRASILADLTAFVGADDVRRAELGSVPIATELAFGIDAEPPVSFDLGDGRTLSLKGKADRVDRTPGGLIAIDYKSGLAKAYQDLGPGDPTKSGSRFQLPVYALAAQQRYGMQSGEAGLPNQAGQHDQAGQPNHAGQHDQAGQPNQPVWAEYWFTSRRGRFERVGFLVDDAVLAKTRTALRTVVDAITSGIFPARPLSESGAWNCAACTAAGHPEVQRAWLAKSGDPVIDGYLAMLAGPR
jgi:ATP-dependent helicase/nuclease subunit B